MEKKPASTAGDAKFYVYSLRINNENKIIIVQLRQHYTGFQSQPSSGWNMDGYV